MPAGDILVHRTPRVYARPTWAEEWVLKPSVYVATIQEESGRGIDQIHLFHNTGKILNTETGEFETVEPIDLRGQFVCVEVDKLTSEMTEEELEAIEEEESVCWRWYGYVVNDTHHHLRPAAIVEGEEASEVEDRRPMDQAIVALGLEYLLTRRIIHGAWAVGTIKADGTSDDGEPQRIDVCPAFNSGRRNDMTIRGNRTDEPIDLDEEDEGEPTQILEYHVFSGRPEPTATWSAYQIIRYVIKHFGIDVLPFGIQPAEGEGNEVAAALDAIIPPSFSAEGMSVLGVINAFVGPHNGMDWRLVFTEDAHFGTLGPYIEFFSVSDTEVTIEDATVPAVDEDDVIDLNLDERIDVTDFSLTGDETARFGSVIVRGRPILVCASVSAEDETFENAWTDAQQTAFNTTGADLLNKDVERTDSPVYRRYRLPKAWSWSVKNGENEGSAIPINVKTDDDGSLTTARLAQRNWGTVFSEFLPLEEVRGSTEADPEDDERFYRLPFGVVKYVDLEAITKWCYLTGSPDGLFGGAGIAFSNLTGHIFLTGSSPYTLARDHLPIASANTVIATTEVDWTKIILTLAIRMDAVLSVRRVLDEDRPEELVINVPDAEMWLIAPGTVLKVEANALIRQAATAGPGKLVPLRDDSKRLRQIAASAEAWLSEERRPAKIGFSTINLVNTGVGTFLGNLAGDDAHQTNSVVTKRVVDFINQTTGIQTSYELPRFQLVNQGSAES